MLHALAHLPQALAISESSSHLPYTLPGNRLFHEKGRWGGITDCRLNWVSPPAAMATADLLDPRRRGRAGPGASVAVEHPP